MILLNNGDDDTAVVVLVLPCNPCTGRAYTTSGCELSVYRQLLQCVYVGKMNAGCVLFCPLMETNNSVIFELNCQRINKL